MAQTKATYPAGSVAGMDVMHQSMPHNAPVPGTTDGGVRFESAAVVEARVQAEYDATHKTDHKLTDIQSDALAGYCQKLYQEAVQARRVSGLTDELLDHQRRMASKYDSQKLAQLLAKNQQETFYPLTAMKAHDCAAWESEIINAVGDSRAWFLSPTEQPSLAPAAEMKARAQVEQEVQTMAQAGDVPGPEEIAEQAETRQQIIVDGIKSDAAKSAAKMESLIHDQLQECKSAEIDLQFRQNQKGFGRGYLKGPIMRKRKQLVWSATGKVEVSEKIIPTVEAPNPLDIFLSPDSSRARDGNVFQDHVCTRTDLLELRGTSKYVNDANIDAILAMPSIPLQEQLRPEDIERRGLEGKQPAQASTDPRPHLYEFWGKVPGSVLIGIGITAGIKPEGVYAYEVHWCGGKTIKAVPNPDPLGLTPYEDADFKDKPHAACGYGIPELGKVPQDFLNAAQRALSKNMAHGAGFQRIVDLSQMPSTFKPTSIIPFDTLFVESKQGFTTAPITDWQPKMVTDQLLRVIGAAKGWMDDVTGIPPHDPADLAASAGRTSTGLKVLIGMGHRGMEDSLANRDYAWAGIVERFYNYNMVYHSDPAVKGDVQVVVKGTLGMLTSEMQKQQIGEFIDRLNTPFGQEAYGPETYAKQIGRA